MSDASFSHVQFNCSGCGAVLHATSRCVGSRKFCAVCGQINIVPERQGRRPTPPEKTNGAPDEQFFASVLGLNGEITVDEVKHAYKKQLLKYHPDRVEHLGAEFQDLANHKTRQIIEAFEYFKRKFSI